MGGEDERVVEFFGDEPNRIEGSLVVLSDGEILVVFEDGEEADLRLRLYSFEPVVVIHDLIPVEAIRRGGAGEQQIDQLLLTMGMLSDERHLFVVHLLLYLAHSLRQYHTV